jgi:divalent metal cation (Fe/Co/Zn/Cd) transporter
MSESTPEPPATSRTKAGRYWGTVKSIGRRLMDGIEPDLLDRAGSALSGTPGVLSVSALQLRWVGHRLQGNAAIVVADMALTAAEQIVLAAEHRLGHALPNLDTMSIRTTPATVPALDHEAGGHLDVRHQHK